jgi:hypothetical protein
MSSLLAANEMGISSIERIDRGREPPRDIVSSKEEGDKKEQLQLRSEGKSSLPAGARDGVSAGRIHQK